mmetsp:Transcript_2337/g.3720  ORF Transcript_2337/g.3720 Transcript_2337/m.3720 type:complete len:89 (+) Transcript_2337:439-705(+)
MLVMSSSLSSADTWAPYQRKREQQRYQEKILYKSPRVKQPSVREDSSPFCGDYLRNISLNGNLASAVRTTIVVVSPDWLIGEGFTLSI